MSRAHGPQNDTREGFAFYSRDSRRPWMVVRREVAEARHSLPGEEGGPWQEPGVHSCLGSGESGGGGEDLTGPHRTKGKGGSLSRVRLFANPWTIQSMGFSRPESWSEGPFPSPGDLPNPGMEPRSPTLQADSSPAEQTGKPKKTGVGSLSLLQGIFPTQDLNRSLLHCRRTLY